MAGPNDAALLSDKVVLVVDDEKFSRGLVRKHLDALGVVITYEAVDGELALEQLSESWRGIDIVISDFEMPVKNGLTLLQTIRSGRAAIRHDLPVIMLTGHTDNQLVATALSLDVDGFIVKPVSRDTLAARLRRLSTGSRDLKPAAYYAGIDLKSFGQAAKAAPAKPLPTIPPLSPGRTTANGVPTETAVPIAALEAPAVLARDITLPGGVVVLPAGTKLSQRLIERLRDLAALGIQEVWVTPS